MLPDNHNHYFESGNWGVIFGASRCIVCGEIATEKHFKNQLTNAAKNQIIADKGENYESA